MTDLSQKKFKCEHPGCEKSFNRRDYLIRHSANHLEVLPHKCPECPLRFARADLLEKHLNTKSHEKRRKREERRLLEQQQQKTKVKQIRRKSKDREIKNENVVQQAAQELTRANSQDQSPNLYNYQVYQQQHRPQLQQIKSEVDPHSNGSQAPYMYTNGTQITSHHHHQPHSSSRLDTLFTSFPETLPDEFGNIDASSAVGSDIIDYNVSGNYAWLFGRDFWSDVYPKGASNAYNQLTDNSSMYPANGTPYSTSNGQEWSTSVGNGYHHQENVQWNGHVVASPATPVYMQGEVNTSGTTNNSTNMNVYLNPTPVESEESTNINGDADLMADWMNISSSTQTKIIGITKEIRSIAADSPYFTPESLNRYLYLYWKTFDPIYPIIHKGTFKTEQAVPELLLSMMIIGMAYNRNQDDSYDLALQIYPKIRIAILSTIDDDSDIPLWSLQSLLLINYFIQNFGSDSSIKMSQVFQGTHIALLRLSGYLDKLAIPPIPENYNTIAKEEFWQRYILFETKKRTALFGFICDTQQAVFYRHNLGLSAFEITSELPCSDACWEATDCMSFIEIYKNQPRHIRLRDPSELDETTYFPVTNNSHPPSPRYSDDNNEEHFNRYRRGSSMIPSEAAEAEDAKSAMAQPDSMYNNDNEIDGMMEDMPVKTQGNWPTLLFSIRRLMSPYSEFQSEYSLECFSPYSRLILLHGLLSVSWEMQSRGFLDTGIITKRRMNEFKTRLVVAFTNWKGYFDRQLRKLRVPDLNSFVMNTRSNHNKNGPHYYSTNGSGKIEFNDYGNTMLLSSNWSLYHFGLIVLYEDILMIRKYSDLPITKTNALNVEQFRAYGYVNQWVTTLDAKWATWHSMHFLQRIFCNDSLINQVDSLPWCTFVAALTMWAFDTNSNSHEGKKPSQFKTSSAKYCTRIPYNEPVHKSKFAPRITVNAALAGQDALQYLDIVKNCPPKCLTYSSPTSSIHDETSSIITPTTASTTAYTCSVDDAVKRSELVISVMAYTFTILQKFDASGGKYLIPLQNLLERYL